MRKVRADRMARPTRTDIRQLRDRGFGEPPARRPAIYAADSRRGRTLERQLLVLRSVAGNQLVARLAQDVEAGVIAPQQELEAPPAKAEVKHYTINPDVNLETEAEAVVATIADAYYALRKKDIVVTSGTRTAASQAQAMFVKLEMGDDVSRLYGGSRAVRAIKKAYDRAKKAGDSVEVIVAAMIDVIEKQIASGVYISKHLRAGAVDIRSRDMSGADKAAFRKAIAGKMKSVILETKPPHWHLQL